MLRSIGPGVVLDAVVQAGYVNVYNDFDSAEFQKLDDDHVVRLTVTYELRYNATPQEVALSQARRNGEQLADVPDNLPGIVAELAQALVKRGCAVHTFSPGSQRDDAVASFERLDVTQCLNRLVITMVKVRVTRQRRVANNGEW